MSTMPENLPEHSVVLLNYLSSVGSSTQRELIEKLELPVRKIRYALRRLKEENLIIGRPDLYDMRSLKYEINQEEENRIRTYLEGINGNTSISV